MKELTYNAQTFQRSMYKMFLDRRRDIEHECGYPDTAELGAEQYKVLYEREPIAAKVVELYPNGCWSVQPELIEDEDVKNTTKFEQAWEDVAKTLKGGSFFDTQDDASHPMWEYLARGDKLSGIGRYGVLLLGLDDGKELDEPAEFNLEGNDTASRELLFVRPLDETMAEITQYEVDKTSYRFGLPTEYSVTLESPTLGSSAASGSGVRSTATQDTKVHWTRVAHLADNLGSSEVLGTPRMQIPYNRLYDLYKVYGSSAEMFWLAAFFGISLETHPQLGANVNMDIPGMKKQLENFQNTLQRWLAMPGITAKTLAPQVSDPTNHIDNQLTAICAYLESPKRIFMGSERGELASGQDAKAWHTKMQCRQKEYVTPRIIVPVVDRLIHLGVLPRPDKGYNVIWPDIAAVSYAERTEIANKQADTLAKFVQGDIESIISLPDFLVKIMGMTTDEAAIIEEGREDLPDREEESKDPTDKDGNQPPSKQKQGEDQEGGGGAKEGVPNQSKPVAISKQAPNKGAKDE